MAHIISVCGGKGGVGKTTAVANLGLTLSNMGKEVTLVDTNLTTPSLSLHLGIPLYPVTLHDVLRGEAYITEAMHIHQSGMRIVPASLSLDDLEGTEAQQIIDIIRNDLDDSDVILLDCAAGLGNETVAALKASDELLIITNPELPAVTDALKTKNLARDLGVDVIGAVLNRVEGKRGRELSHSEIKDMLEVPIIARIPEDHRVKEAIRRKKPVVEHEPRAPSSREFRRLAAKLTGEPVPKGASPGLLRRLKEWMRGI